MGQSVGGQEEDPMETKDIILEAYPKGSQFTVPGIVAELYPQARPWERYNHICSMGHALRVLEKWGRVRRTGKVADDRSVEWEVLG